MFGSPVGLRARNAASSAPAEPRGTKLGCASAPAARTAGRFSASPRRRTRSSKHPLGRDLARRPPPPPLSDRPGGPGPDLRLRVFGEFEEEVHDLAGRHAAQALDPQPRRDRVEVRHAAHPVEDGGGAPLRDERRRERDLGAPVSGLPGHPLGSAVEPILGTPGEKRRGLRRHGPDVPGGVGEGGNQPILHGRTRQPAGAHHDARRVHPRSPVGRSHHPAGDPRRIGLHIAEPPERLDQIHRGGIARRGSVERGPDPRGDSSPHAHAGRPPEVVGTPVPHLGVRVREPLGEVFEDTGRAHLPERGPRDGERPVRLLPGAGRTAGKRADGFESAAFSERLDEAHAHRALLLAGERLEKPARPVGERELAEGEGGICADLGRGIGEEAGERIESARVLDGGEGEGSPRPYERVSTSEEFSERLSLARHLEVDDLLERRGPQEAVRRGEQRDGHGDRVPPPSRRRSRNPRRGPGSGGSWGRASGSRSTSVGGMGCGGRRRPYCRGPRLPEQGHGREDLRTRAGRTAPAARRFQAGVLHSAALAPRGPRPDRGREVPPGRAGPPARAAPDPNAGRRLPGSRGRTGARAARARRAPPPRARGLDAPPVHAPGDARAPRGRGPACRNELPRLLRDAEPAPPLLPLRRDGRLPPGARDAPGADARARLRGPRVLARGQRAPALPCRGGNGRARRARIARGSRRRLGPLRPRRGGPDARDRGDGPPLHPLLPQVAQNEGAGQARAPREHRRCGAGPRGPHAPGLRRGRDRAPPRIPGCGRLLQAGVVRAGPRGHPRPHAPHPRGRRSLPPRRRRTGGGRRAEPLAPRRIHPARRPCGIHIGRRPAPPTALLGRGRGQRATSRTSSAERGCPDPPGVPEPVRRGRGRPEPAARGSGGASSPGPASRSGPPGVRPPARGRDRRRRSPP